MKKWVKIVAAIFGIIILVLLVALALVELNQKKILTYVEKELRKNVIGELTLDKVSFTIFKGFPNVSLTLENIVLKDSIYKKEVFRAGTVYCRISLLKLLYKKIDVHAITVEDGNIFLQQDSSGHLNAAMFRIKKREGLSEPMDINFDLDQLKIIGVHLSFNDELRNKHMSLTAQDMLGNISMDNGSYDISLQGIIHSDSMMFKADRGSFLFNLDADALFKLNFNPKEMKLKVLPSTATVEGEKYDMSGFFQFDVQPPYMRLVISKKDVDFEKGRRVLSSQIQEKMKDLKVPTPVEVNIIIKGGMAPDFPPEVDASFKLHKGRIEWYAAEVTNVELDGLFMNHVVAGVKNDDPNSMIRFDIAKAEVNGVPFQAFASVTDLKALHMKAMVVANTALSAFNQSIGPDTSIYHFTAGRAALKINYSGTIYFYLDTIKREFDDTLSGALSIEDGGFEYATRNIQLSAMDAFISFNEKQLDIDHVHCALNGNEINVTGSLSSLRRMVSGYADKMVGNLRVQTKKFDLSKVLVMKKGFVPATPMPKVSSKQVDAIRAAIDSLTNKLTVNVNIKCDEFAFRKIRATNMNGDISMSSRGMEVKSLNFGLCKGDVKLQAALNTTQKADRLFLDAHIRNVDMKNFLTATENFDQTAIKDENIEGSLNADVHFYSPLDAKYNVVPDSMNGVLGFKLQNGSLLNFEPIGNVGKKIFKKRDFNNITFAEIKDSVLVKGETVYFNRMEVASSVMRLFVQGQFSFNGFTDLSIQVPLSNLKKTDIDYSPENIGVDSKGGASIFLRVKGPKDNIKITLDPTARQRLKKEGTKNKNGD